MKSPVELRALCIGTKTLTTALSKPLPKVWRYRMSNASQYAVRSSEQSAQHRGTLNSGWQQPARMRANGSTCKHRGRCQWGRSTTQTFV